MLLPFREFICSILIPLYRPSGKQGDFKNGIQQQPMNAKGEIITGFVDVDQCKKSFPKKHK